jgi:hypothetical protein
VAKKKRCYNPRMAHIIKCDLCSKKVSLHSSKLAKGKRICYYCSRNFPHPQPLLLPKITLKEALRKIRTVRFRRMNNGYISGCINVPTILAGRKVRLVLAKEKEEVKFENA